MAEEQFEQAAEILLRSCKLSRQSGLPYEEARTRLMLGMAYRAQGADDFAELELNTARSVLERLSAIPDVHRAEEFLSPA